MIFLITVFLLLLLLALSPFLVGIGLLFRWPRTPSPGRLALQDALLAGMCMFLASGVKMVRDTAIANKTDALAGVFYLFLPFCALMYAAPMAGIGWCVGYLRAKRNEGTSKYAPTRMLAWSGIVLILGFGTVKVGQAMYLSRQIKRISHMNPEEMQQVLDSPFLGKNEFIVRAIALAPQVDADMLHRIASVDNPAFHQITGGDFWTSLFGIELSGETRNWGPILRIVASHPRVRSDTLELLAQSPNDDVLGDVAKHATLSQATLQRLAKRGGFSIEWGLSQNPKVSAEILLQLSRSESPYTRAHVAEHPHTPGEVLLRLSQDPDWLVRANVARNLLTPLEVVRTLSQDGDSRVRDAAKQRLG